MTSNRFSSVSDHNCMISGARPVRVASYAQVQACVNWGRAGRESRRSAGAFLRRKIEATHLFGSHEVFRTREQLRPESQHSASKAGEVVFETPSRRKLSAPKRRLFEKQPKEDSPKRGLNQLTISPWYSSL